MPIINEKTFLDELLKALPEFAPIHEKKTYHDLGIHFVWDDLRRFCEQAIRADYVDLLNRINVFLTRCHSEDDGQVQNALFVSFFEHLDPIYLEYCYNNLPKVLVDELKYFINQ